MNIFIFIFAALSVFLPSIAQSSFDDFSQEIDISPDEGKSFVLAPTLGYDCTRSKSLCAFGQEVNAPDAGEVMSVARAMARGTDHVFYDPGRVWTRIWGEAHQVARRIYYAQSVQ